MSEAKRTIPPELARMLVGDDSALVGAGKMAFCEHEGKTLFGGVVRPNISDPSYGDWEMSVGTLIWVPCDIYVPANPDGMGWELSDIIQGGFDPKYWTEDNSNE